MREEILPARETPTPLRGDEEYIDNEYRLNKLISVDISTIKNKIISNIKFFVDAVSC
jgi:hypothetical protein